MILKTAYLEIKEPTKDCPFLHGEIHFSNDTKCPVYSKSDGEFVIQRAKELSLIDDVELMILEGDIKKSDLIPEMHLTVIEKNKRTDLGVPFGIMIIGLLEEILTKAKNGEILEIDLNSHVQKKFKDLTSEEGGNENYVVYNA